MIIKSTVIALIWCANVLPLWANILLTVLIGLSMIARGIIWILDN